MADPTPRRRRGPGLRELPRDIELRPELPITAHAPEIERLLASQQVVIVAGETGSGKTTQLPKICLRAGLGSQGMIGHTQPRRLAAMSVAARISEELGVANGSGVGTQVRFGSRVSEQTFLKLMTDGILLAEIQHDRELRKYQALIVDEAHERSLNIDFLLGYLKLLLPRRKELRLIVTSATLDVERIAAHFGAAPVVSVAGRGYPVETLYRPVEQLAPGIAEDEQQMAAIAAALAALESSGPGDVLVFLSSEKEIRETALFLRRQCLPNTEILPLYARLRAAEQQRIFAPHSRRRVVLATNVAETSLTVPGIHFVIDSGFARISRYSVQRKLTRLPVEPVSQASANQRKGRCGRLAPGICIRLYSEEDYRSRPVFTDPEIKRSNLDQVILRMQALGLGRPEDFPFLDAPSQKSINDGRSRLRELGALTTKERLSRIGRLLAGLPLEPSLGRMLVAARSLGSLRELLVIVSALSLGELREAAAKAGRGEQQERFTHPESDFLGLLALWQQCERERASASRLRQFCKAQGLSLQRVREWREIHRQLLAACRRLGLRPGKAPANYDEVHRALVSGSLNQVARHHEGRVYQGMRNRKLSLAPASVLAGKRTRWIVTSEWIETERTFAAMAARIKPEWALEFAGELPRKEYGEPFWSDERQQVMVRETTLLHGLALREQVAVDYAKFDPEGAREQFIDEALVEERIRSKAAVLVRNSEFLAELRRQEEKFRKPQLLVNEREMRHFLEQRIPRSVASTRKLEQWLEEDPARHGELLDMRQAGLFQGNASNELQRQFPDRIKLQNNVLPLDYVFEPGGSRDGPSLRVPVALVAQLSGADLDWAVPGLVREKCIALIRGLPKRRRRSFIPVPDFVDAALPAMSRADGDLIDSLLGQMRARDHTIERGELLAVALPAHLRTRAQVVDQNGGILGESAELAELQARFAGQAPPRCRHALERERLRDWDFDELPESVEVGDQVILLRYPGLVDHDDSVAIALFETKEQALAVSIEGAMRLFMLRSIARRNDLRKRFQRFRDRNAARIWLVPGLREVAGDAVQSCYLEAFALREAIPRSRKSFDSLLACQAAKLPKLADELERLLNQVLDQLHEIRQKLAELPERHRVREDIEAQVERLLPERFLRDTRLVWLRHFPRYLEGILVRLEKSPFFGPADEKHGQLVAYYWQRFEQLPPARGNSGIAESLRWSIEEFRVSLFAQKLGTSIPVSSQRLDKQLAKLTE